MTGTVALSNRLAGRPTVLHTHGLIYGTRAFWRLKLLLSRLYYEPLIRATKTFVVCSSSPDRDRLIAFMPRVADSSAVIENGVDLSPFQGIDRSPVPGRIVVVGRVTPLKGIEGLLRALPHVAVPWSLLVHGAGEGDEPTRLMQLARSLGIAARVEFTGPYATAGEPGLFTTPTLAVFPSTSEAMGMALVDAMAAGVPVLASDIAAHRDLLERVAPESLVDFSRPVLGAESIDRHLTASLAQTTALTTRLRKRAQSFDVDRLVSEIDDLYRELGIGQDNVTRPKLA